MKYYIIQEIGYEYNDEIYHQSNSGGGTPVKVFKSKSDAQAEVDKLNFNKFQTEPLCQYTYSLDDIISNVEEFCEKLSKIAGKEINSEDIEGDYEFTLPKMSVKEFNSIKNMIDLSFYEIVECDGE
jgi:pantothenate kinase